MNLNVWFISGPPNSGKSSLVRMLATTLRHSRPHYLRLVPVEGGPRLTLLGDLKQANLSSWKRLNYDAEHIFEFLPECLGEIAARHGSPMVLIEADADPNLRYAYPYDHRVFVMAAPSNVHEVFRTADQAAVALQEVMDDTAAFASEIFGLFDPRCDDSAVYMVTEQRGATEERLEITPAQMRRFIVSPLGVEIASRIQLQPAFHGLMESDIIVVNIGAGGQADALDRSVRQIQTLISRTAEGKSSAPRLFSCNLGNGQDPATRQLLNHLASRLE